MIEVGRAAFHDPDWTNAVGDIVKAAARAKGLTLTADDLAEILGKAR